VALRWYVLGAAAAAGTAYGLGATPGWSLAVCVAAPLVLAAAPRFLLATIIGAGAVQEVVAGAPMQDCTRTMVVTNHEFTPAARKLAELHGCELVGGVDLKRLRSTLRRLTAAPTEV
jgi:hypothetical protein